MGTGLKPEDWGEPGEEVALLSTGRLMQMRHSARALRRGVITSLSLLALLISGTTSGQVPPPTVGSPSLSVATFRIVNLGTYDQGMVLRGVNNVGEVVGGAQTSSSGDRAFVVTRSRLETIDGLPNTEWSAALGINDAGVVVGSFNSATALRAFVWPRAGRVRDLGTLSGDSGSAGLSRDQSAKPDRWLFEWSPGVPGGPLDPGGGDPGSRDARRL